MTDDSLAQCSLLTAHCFTADAGIWCFVRGNQKVFRFLYFRKNHAADLQISINDKSQPTMDSQGEDGAEAPPPAGTVDESISEEHMQTAGTDDESPSDCDSSDSSTSSGDDEQSQSQNGETNDQNSRNMTPNCSALLCWLRTFPVLEDHHGTGGDSMGSNFGDREVVT